MKKNEKKDRPSGERTRVALITNHGYAGVDIPVGGAPDTGGQNFYVNSLAEALDECGFEVTIFARGGFPFFQSDRLRQEPEQLTEHVRYVYVPGGGNDFLRKEDIAVALDEQTTWLEGFISDEATSLGLNPWEVYEVINTHYWDAAVIGVKLTERFANLAARSFISKALRGRLEQHMGILAGEQVHRLSLARQLPYYLGTIGLAATDTTNPQAALEQLLGNGSHLPPAPENAPMGTDEFMAAQRLGLALEQKLEVDGSPITKILKKLDHHVWTPHSLGIIKERNFWNKEPETVRALKFRERDSHEDMLCRRTPLFCSTSPELFKTLVSYHQVEPRRIFDFPPCIDQRKFRPRTDAELADVYDYLGKTSGISVEKLKAGKIVFETSRMDKTKRKDLLLSAFDQIVDDTSETYLFIGGGPASSPVFKQLQQLLQSLPRLKGRAFLLGFVPDEVIEPIFSVADLFVSASEMEGFGMSVSQAAAAGVPVISSDLIPFATQYAADAAVVVPAGDVDRFATAMKQLLADESQRQQLGVKLLKIAGELDWPKTATRFIEWFNGTHNTH